jgi:hypothetical protein
MRFFRSKEMDLCDASELNMEKANDAEQVSLVSPLRNEGGFFQRRASMHKKAKNTGNRSGSLSFFRSKEMDRHDASELDMERENDVEQVSPVSPARNEGSFFQRRAIMHKKAKNTSERRGSLTFFRSKEMDVGDASELCMAEANDVRHVSFGSSQHRSGLTSNAPSRDGMQKNPSKRRLPARNNGGFFHRRANSRMQANMNDCEQ